MGGEPRPFPHFTGFLPYDIEYRYVYTGFREVDNLMEKNKTNLNIAVEWNTAIQVAGSQVRGRVELNHGKLVQAEINPGQGSAQDGQFTFAAGRRTRLNLAIAGVRLGPGANATLITIENNLHSFSFFLRDVTQAFPIYLPDCAAVVTTAEDPRSYAQIAQDISLLAMRTRLQCIQDEPEESFPYFHCHTTPPFRSS